MNEVNLPSEWQHCFLGDLLSGIQTGKSVRCDERPPRFQEKGLVKISAVTWGVFNENESKTLLSTEHLQSNHKIDIGDLLISRANTLELVGACVMVKNLSKNLYLSDKVLRLEIDELLKPLVLRYLNSKDARIQIESLATGNQLSMRNISQDAIRAIKLPLPPLAEQKVIADKLDTLLAQVETTKARLERIPEILKSFRQSVLTAAVTGKLTEEWRNTCGCELKKYCSGDELSAFRGHQLQSLPNAWQWLRFDQVADIASNLVDPFDNLVEIHIAPNHIESWTGVISGFQTVGEDGVTSAKHRFKKGQILYSKIRPYLAKVTIAKFDGLCSADMYPINSLIDTQYLYRWMLTSIFTDWASNAESRSVLPKINQKDLSMIPVPTPPVEEQTEIVRRVEQLFAFADSIEQKANAALARVNNLTQSILAKAFRGELTADWRAANLDLISGDNSAEALLTKIKTERAKLSQTKKSRSKTVEN